MKGFPSLVRDTVNEDDFPTFPVVNPCSLAELRETKGDLLESTDPKDEIISIFISNQTQSFLISNEDDHIVIVFIADEK